ncbi:MAG: hypothetical protein HQL91_08405 [Magnetococcales bacterium]|nr:hypothetical protein [Magnetococcales bacterium]
MRTLHRLWSALELLPGLSSVLAEWRQLLGVEFEVSRQLLRPTRHRAEFYPCPNPGGEGCPRRVVDRGERGLVAVCGDAQGGCRDLVLTPKDLVVYELDRGRLGLLTAVALGATPITCIPVNPLRETLRIGEYHPRAGDRFPLFLTIQPNSAQLREVAFTLLRTEPKPFILVIPTDLFMTADLRQMASEHKSRILPIGDIIAVDAEMHNLIPTSGAAECLAAFHAEVMPDSEARKRFPTPPDTLWSQIKIRFLNRDTVTIQCQGMVRTTTYHDAGMSDGRSGQPNKQWMLLYQMADDRGRMDIHSPHVSQLNKKRKETLCKSLHAYFGIADDPIFWDEESSSYITRFTLEPEG